MPRGGYRPGSGAKKGNTNALKDGANSTRASKLATVLRTHPNVREIIRIALVRGIVHLGPPPYDLARVVDELYPAVFDRNHPWYNQIHQEPESGYPKPWPGPSFTADELVAIERKTTSPSNEPQHAPTSRRRRATDA